MGLAEMALGGFGQGLDRHQDWSGFNFKGSLPQFSQDPSGGLQPALPLARRKEIRFP